MDYRRKKGIISERKNVMLTRKRWCVLEDAFLKFFDEEKNLIKDVFLFDARSTIQERPDRYLELTNSSCTKTFWCENAEETREWVECIDHNMQKVIGKIGSAPNNSFAPVRLSAAHWFVDGAQFFSAVKDALQSATEEIFIAGWWIVSSIYLKRKEMLKDGWMLESILKRKAEQGLKIYILAYNAPRIVMNHGVDYLKRHLEDLNVNIKVILHRSSLGMKTWWSHHEKLVVVDQSIAFVSGLDLTIGRWDYHKHLLTDLSDSSQTTNGTNPYKHHPIWEGIDYFNEYQPAVTEFDTPKANHLNRHSTPRMPWHDVGSVTYHESARDVARHFIQRWNSAKKEHSDEYPFLVPKAEHIPGQKSAINIHPKAMEANVQVLRSSTTWSAGLLEKESSIHEAYIQAISNAEHFIYIENQFFLGLVNGGEIQNEIVAKLCDRILAKQGKHFRVYIVVPLVPAFKGDFSKKKKSSWIQRVISYFQHMSMDHGETSLVGALQKRGMSKEEVEEHVCFCSLRAKGQLDGKAITEVLYVHSKIMVVDDKIAIIGSANINDRSMLGSRDSEVAICVTDTEMTESVMDGKRCMVGKFSSSLRKRLFAEHLGMLPENFDDEASEFEGCEQLNDVVSEAFYHDVWKKTASENTKLYDKALKPMPSDNVLKFSQVEEYQSGAVEDQQTRRDILKQVVGNLVQHPTKYLQDDPFIAARIPGVNFLLTTLLCSYQGEVSFSADFSSSWNLLREEYPEEKIFQPENLSELQLLLKEVYSYL